MNDPQKKYSSTKMQKMTGSNPNLDFVYINAYAKFGELLFCSQDIERKRNFE